LVKAIEQIEFKSKIYTIRGVKVMLDRDLAELYDVPTKRLNEQVKRNISRFPNNFMFQLTKNEAEEVSRSKYQISATSIHGTRGSNAIRYT